LNAASIALCLNGLNWKISNTNILIKNSKSSNCFTTISKHYAITTKIYHNPFLKSYLLKSPFGTSKENSGKWRRQIHPIANECNGETWICEKDDIKIEDEEVYEVDKIIKEESETKSEQVEKESETSKPSWISFNYIQPDDVNSQSTHHLPD